jgi:hypothetical protein
MTAADLTPDNLAILEAKLRADLDMVLKVRAVLEEHLGNSASILALPAPAIPPVASTPAPLRGPVSLDQMPFPAPQAAKTVKTEVRAVVEALSGPFKIGAVKSGLQKRYATFPDTSVRSVLMRMVQAGELKFVERGFGRAGSTFQKVGGAAENAGDSDDSAPV